MSSDINLAKTIRQKYLIQCFFSLFTVLAREDTIYAEKIQKQMYIYLPINFCIYYVWGQDTVKIIYFFKPNYWIVLILLFTYKICTIEIWPKPVYILCKNSTYIFTQKEKNSETPQSFTCRVTRNSIPCINCTTLPVPLKLQIFVTIALVSFAS